MRLVAVDCNKKNVCCLRGERCLSSLAYVHWSPWKQRLCAASSKSSQVFCRLLSHSPSPVGVWSCVAGTKGSQFTRGIQHLHRFSPPSVPRVAQPLVLVKPTPGWLHGVKILRCSYLRALCDIFGNFSLSLVGVVPVCPCQLRGVACCRGEKTRPISDICGKKTVETSAAEGQRE